VTKDLVEFEGQFYDRYFEHSGLRLHYTLWNPTASKTCVLLHGLNVQAHTWDPIAATLAESRRVICLDLRGHGDSDWSRSGYGVSDFTGDLAALFDVYELSDVALVTHSLGARIGIAFAGEFSHRLSSLFLSDTAPEMPKSTASSVASFISSTNRVPGFRDRDEARAFYQTQHAEWLPIFLDLHAQYQIRRNWAGKYVLKSDPELYWITRGAGVREIPYLWDAASRINVPTVIMRGNSSSFISSEHLARLCELIPDTTVRSFETGHYIPREDPEAFTRCVVDFLHERRL
jgi:pimeloyl-ACP methyl ester carboxylesterase